MKTKLTGKLSGLTGILLLFAVIVLVNALVAGLHLRWDLTADKLYTLSPGTRDLLANLDRTVTLKFYFSRSNPAVPISIKRFADRILDLLHEYQRAGHGRVVVETYDPRPDTDEEEWAQRYGIQPQSLGLLGSGADFYIGLTAVCGTRENTLPVISPSDEPRLEYMFSRMILDVTRNHQPTVGILSSLPVMGDKAAFPGANRKKPWLFIQELKKQCALRRLPEDTSTIPEDLDALILVHPQKLSEKTLFAIDQYVLNGGHLLAFVDPLCISQEQSSENPSPYASSSSNINRLMEAWGLRIPPARVVSDLRAATHIRIGDGSLRRLPTWLSLRPGAINTNEVVASGLELIMMPFAGAILGDPAPGLTMTKLVQTSPDALLISSFAARNPDPLTTSYDSRQAGPVPLAVRLTGKFKTAFPNGPPSSKKSTNTVSTASSTNDYLKESVRDGAVVVVADVDLLCNEYAARSINFLGRTFYQPLNDNLNSLLNLVEELTGGSTLIGLRTRGTFERPFERVVALEKQAQERWRREELALMDQLRTTQARLNELQRTKDKQHRYILSPEQKREIEKFRRRKFETQRKLKQVRKNLRRDIEALGMKIKIINMAAMPALVALGGLIHAWRRRRRALRAADTGRAAARR